MTCNLMDIEAGGETSQYESIQTVPKPSSTERGQFGGVTQAVTEPSQEQQGKAERGNKTAENVRYGQAISEQGIGGKTPEEGGEANRDGFGPVDAQTEGAEMTESRQKQGFGPGAGVGA